MNWLMFCFLLDNSISERILEPRQGDAVAGAVMRVQQQQQQHLGGFGTLFWGVGGGEQQRLCCKTRFQEMTFQSFS